MDNIRSGLSGDYVLGADIDLSGYPNWVPIGTPSAPFTGTLDGTGYTISNLAINRPTEDYIGLFGSCSFATLAKAPNLKNLAITGANITGQDCTGVLAGQILTTLFVENGGLDLVQGCNSAGSVSGRNQVGGLAGYVQGPAYAGHVIAPNVNNYIVFEEVLARITNCNSTAAVTGSGANIGGLIGRLNEIRPYQSRASGAVTGGDIVGGLVGYYYRGACDLCFATGDVTGTVIAGGLIGRASYRPIVSRSYAEGDVTGTGAYEAPTNYMGVGYGGLIGDCEIEAIDKCYAIGNVTGPCRVGGLIGGCHGGNYRSPNISHCFAWGNVEATSMAAGGLIGYIYADMGEIEQGYCAGSVTAPSDAGAVIGQVGVPPFPGATPGTPVIIEPLYFNSAVNTVSTVNGGRGLSAAAFQADSTFDGAWSGYDSIWVIDLDEANYPLLRVFYDPVGISLASTKGTATQGLVLAYTTDGKVFYRAFDGASWAAEVGIPALPEPASALSIFATNDLRIGFITDVAGALSWALTQADSMTIEHVKSLPAGTCGNLIQTDDDVPKLYSINAVQSLAKNDAIFAGNWAALAFGGAKNIPSDNYMSRLKAKYFGGKTWAVWRSRGQHRISPQDEAADVEEALDLVSGSITLRQDTPVVSVSLEVDSFDRTEDGPYGYPIFKYETSAASSVTEVPNGYIGIYTAVDLNNVRNNLSGNYIQMADIDLSGYTNWVPIADYDSNDPFSGIYDFNGFEVSFLTVNSTKNDVGLFGWCIGATFTRVRIINCDVITTRGDAGALAGYIEDCTLYDCYSSGRIQAASYAGGLVGAVWPSTIDRCGSGCDVYTTSTAGGLFGSTRGVILKQCFADGNVTGNQWTGGLIGEVLSGGVEDAYSRGDVIGNSGPIGGLIGCIGEFENSTIVRAYATGNVANGRVASNVGPVVGYAYPGTVVSDTYYDYTTTMQTGSPGIPKSTPEMQQQATFVGWDFETIWKLSAKDEYIPNYPPASTLQLRFKAGDSDPLPMGIFYVDRTQFAVGRENVSVNARNSIGKYLKDQTFDERNNYPVMDLQTILAQILTGAGITYYYVGPETSQVGMAFAPNQPILDGIDDVLTAVRDWQIREEADGKVVVAERTDVAFTQPGTYTFYRNQDVFSRSVTKDDGQTYGRVCVHTGDFTVRVYRPISSSLGWLPPAQKTLYIQAPDGTLSVDAAALATEIAGQLSNSGEVEDFVGPIRPQLLPGDQAQIVDEDGPNLLGTITTVTHRFGLDGFYTAFTVDSGGKINRPMLKDYLQQVSSGVVKAKRTY
jgi:hypothetical protein